MLLRAVISDAATEAVLCLARAHSTILRVCGTALWVTGGVPRLPLWDLPKLQPGEQAGVFREALTIQGTAPIPLFPPADF